MLVSTLCRLFKSTCASNIGWKSVYHVLNSKSDLALLERGDCGTNPSWQTTISAWDGANTDSNLASWWSNVTDKPHQGFANELADGFGKHSTGFLCGIGAFSTCIAPGCSGMIYLLVLRLLAAGILYNARADWVIDYQDDSDPVWAFLSLMSVVNLNTYFNNMFVSIRFSKYCFSR